MGRSEGESSFTFCLLFSGGETRARSTKEANICAMKHHWIVGRTNEFLRLVNRFSATWFARALPEDGKVVTCELEPKHAEVRNSILFSFQNRPSTHHSQPFTHIANCECGQVARQNLITTGVSSKVDIVLGPAVETLAAMPTPPESELFDLAFIDADKENNLNYFLQAKRLVRKGGVIVRFRTNHLIPSALNAFSASSFPSSMPWTDRGQCRP